MPKATTGPSRSQPVVRVFNVQTLIPGSHFHQGLPPRQDSKRIKPNPLRGNEPFQHVISRQRLKVGPVCHSSYGLKRSDVAVNKIQFRARLENLQLFLNLVGREHIVAIDKLDKLTVRDGKSGVVRAAHSLLGWRMYRTSVPKRFGTSSGVASVEELSTTITSSGRYDCCKALAIVISTSGQLL